MEPMSKVREEAFLRLKNRAARLVRLIDLDAPDIILVNEVFLLAEAGKMLSPEYWFSKEAKKSADRFKTQLKLCCHDDCEEQVAWIPSSETPTCPGPFHGQSCLPHALEDEKDYNKEYEPEDEEDECS